MLNIIKMIDYYIKKWMKLILIKVNYDMILLIQLKKHMKNNRKKLNKNTLMNILKKDIIWWMNTNDIVGLMIEMNIIKIDIIMMKNLEIKGKNILKNIIKIKNQN